MAALIQALEVSESPSILASSITASVMTTVSGWARGPLLLLGFPAPSSWHFAAHDRRDRSGLLSQESPNHASN